jgi:hypothetical protein
MFQVPMVLGLSSRDAAMIDLADIAPDFLFIIGKGFVPGTSIYKPEEFGNATLVMIGVPFSLRFERDRGQVFVDIGSDSSGWCKLEYVLEFVDNSVTQSQLGEPPSPALMASLVQGRWDKAVDLFTDQQRILQLQAFAKQKSNALLNRLFGKP